MRVNRKLFHPLKRLNIEGIASEYKADEYAKKMSLRNHLTILTIAFVKGKTHLSEIEELSKNPKIQTLGIVEISKSQLSKLHHSDIPNRPPTTSKPIIYLVFL